MNAAEKFVDNAIGIFNTSNGLIRPHFIMTGETASF